ncbi:MAG: hypothetical protein ACE3JP_16230 [Ectobacillus sp.]
MENKNTIVRNIAIGVAVGAAVTMLKKENRKMVASNVRKAKTKMVEIRQSSVPLKERMKEGVHVVGTKGRELADLKLVKEKVEEFKKLTPAVMETLKETRDIFNKKKQELKEKNEGQAIEEAKAEEPQAAVPSTEELNPETEPAAAKASEPVMEQPDEVQMEQITAEELKGEALLEEKAEEQEKKQTV